MNATRDASLKHAGMTVAAKTDNYLLKLLQDKT